MWRALATYSDSLAYDHPIRKLPNGQPYRRGNLSTFLLNRDFRDLQMFVWACFGGPEPRTRPTQFVNSRTQDFHPTLRGRANGKKGTLGPVGPTKPNLPIEVKSFEYEGWKSRIKPADKRVDIVYLSESGQVVSLIGLSTCPLFLSGFP